MLITHKKMCKTQNKCEKLKVKSNNNKNFFVTEIFLKKDGGLIINYQKCFTICSARLVSAVLI